MNLTSVGGCGWRVSNCQAAVWGRREIWDLWNGMRHQKYRSSRSERLKKELGDEILNFCGPVYMILQENNLKKSLHSCTSSR